MSYCKSSIERLKIFHSGIDCKAYEFFGCHKLKNGNSIFRVWAPHAKSVSLHGYFCGKEHTVSMLRLCDNESFETEIEAYPGDKYCFLIKTEDGRELLKSDPYAFKSDLPYSHYSIVCDLPKPSDYRELFLPHSYNEPINIYEVNLTSWKRHEDNSYYSFAELTKELVPYVKNLGYTHVEFMPVTEYPYDGSWGYQVTGYFSITSRLGSLEDFKTLIDCFHKNGIKVILDWVPAHFPKDDFGLYEFDGQPLYECPLWDRMEHLGWGTRCFDFGRCEIDNFLLSAAHFLFDYFRIDGLRVDAVASILYLNYDRNHNDFTPNESGGYENYEGINFIKKLNESLKKKFAGAITIAEESTAFCKVTGKIEDGGLGFDYKWNMGWMNDVLYYCKQDPYFRNHHHNKLTFSLVYAFSERFILPISHDEVVHVKGSVVNKMPGEYLDKFAGERLFLAYMFAHPGKKLNFMGYEFAQFKEWDYNAGIDLFLADQFDQHAKMRVFIKRLNTLYKSLSALFERDFGWDGFKWNVVDDKYNNLLAFSRFSDSGETLIAIMNFSGIDLKYYSIPSIAEGKYRLILNTDDARFGGNGKVTKKIFNTVKQPDGSESLPIANIPKLSCMYFIKENQ